MQLILGSYSPYLNKVLGVVLRHCATNRKVARSIPGSHRNFSFPFGQIMAMGSTRTLTTRVPGIFPGE